MVVDNSYDKSADIGDFELIFEAQISRFPLYSNKLQLNVEGKRIVTPYKQFNTYKFKSFSDLFIKGNKVVQAPVAKNKNPLAKVTSKYKSKIKNGFGANKRRNLKKPGSPRAIFESVVVQPKITDVSDYVKSLSNMLKTTNKSFVNLNDLKNCLKLNSVEFRDEPRSYMNLRHYNFSKSGSFSNFSDNAQD